MAAEDDAAIAEVRAGRRVKGPHSIHDEAKPNCCGMFSHKWRTLFCNSDEDVVECSECGKQTVCSCSFDDDFA